MKKVKAESLKIGDVILPPQRELSLWMRKDLVKRNLPEKALHITIQEVRQGMPDKNGAWLVVKASRSAEWLEGRPDYPWVIKMRPNTVWPKVTA